MGSYWVLCGVSRLGTADGVGGAVGGKRHLLCVADGVRVDVPADQLSKMAKRVLPFPSMESAWGVGSHE